MAINNYQTLQAAVQNWLDDDTVTAHIADFIMLGEQRVYRKVRVRAMETALSVVISGGEASLPSDFLELKHARIVGSGGRTYPLERKSAEEIYHDYPLRSSDGRPRMVAVDQDNLIFGPYPDSTYTVNGTYYARPSALSASNTSNWFTTDAPDLLLAAALVEATPFQMEDERLAVWAPKLANIIDEVNGEERKEKMSGGPRRSVAR